jgi:cytidine deaminase
VARVADELDPEDAKLATLARAARARANAAEGAAVRDRDGRTYAAASVDLPSLSLTAVQAAVAMAVSSGVGGLEAAVVVTDALGVAEQDADLVRDLAGVGVPIYRADASGDVLDSVTT